MGWTTYQLVSRISEPSTVSPRVIPSSHISPLWLVKPPTQPKLFFTPAPRARCPPRQSSLQLAPLAAYHCPGSLDLIVASVSHFWGEGWFSRPILTYFFSNGFETTTWFFLVSKELCNQVFKRICDRFFLRIMKILVVWIKNLLGLQKWLYLKYDWNVFLYGDADQIR